jgi:hypothetical protein
MDALKNGILGDLASQAKRVPEDLHLVLQLIDLKAAGGYEDDSRYVVCCHRYEIAYFTA